MFFPLRSSHTILLSVMQNIFNAEIFNHKFVAFILALWKTFHRHSSNKILVASFTSVCGQRTKAPTISWWHSSADGAEQRHEEPELGHRLWWNLERNNTDRMEWIDRDKSSGRKTKGESINRQRPTYLVNSVFQIWLWPSGFLFFRTLLSARFSMPFKIDLSRLRDEQEDEKAWCMVCELKEVVATATHSSRHSSLHSSLSSQKWELKIPLIIHPSMFRSSWNKPRRWRIAKNHEKWNTLDTSLTSLIFSTLNYFCWVKKRGRNSHDTWKNSQMVSIGIVTDLHPATTTSHNFKKSRTRWPNQMNSKLPSTWEICIHQCPQHGHRAWGHWSSFDNTPSGCDTLATSHDIVVILTTDWLQRRLLWTTPSTNLMECHNLGFQFHSHSSPDLVWTEISSARTRTTSNLSGSQLALLLHCHLNTFKNTSGDPQDTQHHACSTGKRFYFSRCPNVLNIVDYVVLWRGQFWHYDHCLLVLDSEKKHRFLVTLSTLWIGAKNLPLMSINTFAPPFPRTLWSTLMSHTNSNTAELDLNTNVTNLLQRHCWEITHLLQNAMGPISWFLSTTFADKIWLNPNFPSSKLDK